MYVYVFELPINFVFLYSKMTVLVTDKNESL